MDYQLFMKDIWLVIMHNEIIKIQLKVDDFNARILTDQLTKE